MVCFRILLMSVAALLSLAACSNDSPSPAPPYVPQAQYCVTGPPGSPLCPIIPGNIGPDNALRGGLGYKGIIDQTVTSADEDAQTPFDNLSWQTFVAINWAAGKENLPAQAGLRGEGARVWEGWPRVSAVFGNSPQLGNCNVPPGLPLFAIGSDGKGNPDAHNEEYIQAATGDPAIDVSGNWTIYERRLNNVEVAFLQAPDGKTNWNLTTLTGQQQLIAAGGAVNFPAAGDNGAATGAIEIKAAWRVLDPAQRGQSRRRFYVVNAYLSVAPDLVNQGTGKSKAPICANVDLALVAMHIIQKNPLTTNALLPQWFWSTFEHVDNAPLAIDACDQTSPGACKLLNQVSCPVTLPAKLPDYSYFNAMCPNCPTNVPPTPSTSGPQFAWNPSPPYAKDYLATATSNGQTVTVGTQISRCWKNYSLTDDLNDQWRAELAKIDSVFQNYMLIGTQWGANVEPPAPPAIPVNAVPSFLSNTVVETYLQTSFSQTNVFNNGSCVTCHATATLPADAAKKVSSNFSFVPGLAQRIVLRRPPIGAPGHDTTLQRE